MGLVVIGVPTYLRSKGFGSAMLKEFERIAKKMDSIKLPVSKLNNTNAINIYKNRWMEVWRSLILFDNE